MIVFNFRLLLRSFGPHKGVLRALRARSWETELKMSSVGLPAQGSKKLEMELKKGRKSRRRGKRVEKVEKEPTFSTFSTLFGLRFQRFFGPRVGRPGELISNSVSNLGPEVPEELPCGDRRIARLLSVLILCMCVPIMVLAMPGQAFDHEPCSADLISTPCIRGGLVVCTVIVFARRCGPCRALCACSSLALGSVVA